jgi:hypothetical protein
MERMKGKKKALNEKRVVKDVGINQGKFASQ